MDEKSNSAGALVALFAAAIAAGYSSVELWQMTLAFALLVVMVARLGDM